MYFLILQHKEHVPSVPRLPSTLVWVHGASSNIANAIKTKAITEKHFVKSAQRKPGYAETTKHQYVQLSSNPKKPQEDAIYDKNELLKLFEKNIPTGFAGEILFFNAVGGAHTEKWKNEKMKTDYQSLERFNKKSCIAFFLKRQMTFLRGKI